MKTKNDHPNSKDKIWLFNKTIDEMYFMPNHNKEFNTIEKTMAFLQKAQEKAKELGYEDVAVQGYNDEGDDCNLPSYYIRVYGSRLENDREYVARQESIRIGMKVAYQNYLAQKKRYDDPEVIKDLILRGIA